MYDMKKNFDKTENNQEGLVIGRNPVLEALNAGQNVDTLYVSGEGGIINKICAVAKAQGAVIKNVSATKLDFMSCGGNHQGVIASLSVASYASIDDIFSLANEKNEKPFIIVCDEIEDPHNLGAIIRTAEAVGAHGIIIPKRRSASLNSTVYKTSAGAAAVMKVARVANIASTIDELKSRGVWVYAADMSGQPLYSTDFDGAVCLVIGSEGFGISRLVLDKCDFLVNIPMSGQINSLNASVAAGVIMYEITRQRIK